jgi:hypothetical protein
VSRRQDLLARAFVDVADTLGDDVDVGGCIARLASGCRTAVPDADAGAIARDTDGGLRLVASSTEHLRLLERITVPFDEGPSLDCARSGNPVGCAELTGAHGRWPMFAPAATEAGFESVHALPLRWHSSVIGAVELLAPPGTATDPADLAIVQALADVATITILQQRAAVEAETRAEQLQGALASRVTIEQAKGMLAASSGADPDAAFAALRRYARTRNARLADVAADLVSRRLPTTTVLATG